MANETDTVVDLPLLGQLTYREIHAIEDGIYCGVHGVRKHEYGREKHYWRMGWLLGDAYDRWVRR
jgi:hypothetical protein